MKHTRDDRGSATIEAAIGVPAFMLFVGLIIFGGRTATTHQALQSAASDAARSASLARDAGSAKTAAEKAARSSLNAQDLKCDNVQVHTTTTGFTVAVGQDATVTVTVSCRLKLGDLAVPGVPGQRTISATMTSPLDTWRERS